MKGLVLVHYNTHNHPPTEDIHKLFTLLDSVNKRKILTYQCHIKMEDNLASEYTDNFGLAISNVSLMELTDEECFKIKLHDLNLTVADTDNIEEIYRLCGSFLLIGASSLTDIFIDENIIEEVNVIHTDKCVIEVRTPNTSQTLYALRRS